MPKLPNLWILIAILSVIWYKLNKKLHILYLFNKNIRAMQSLLNFGELIDYTLEWIWLIKETKSKFKRELYTLLKVMIFHFKCTLMIIFIKNLIKFVKKEKNIFI